MSLEGPPGGVPQPKDWKRVYVPPPPKPWSEVEPIILASPPPYRAPICDDLARIEKGGSSDAVTCPHTPHCKSVDDTRQPWWQFWRL